MSFERGSYLVSGNLKHYVRYMSKVPPLHMTSTYFVSYHKVPKDLGIWRLPADHPDGLPEIEDALWNNFAAILHARGYTVWMRVGSSKLNPPQRTFPKPTGYAMYTRTRGVFGGRWDPGTAEYLFMQWQFAVRG